MNRLRLTQYNQKRHSFITLDIFKCQSGMGKILSLTCNSNIDMVVFCFIFNITDVSTNNLAIVEEL